MEKMKGAALICSCFKCCENLDKSFNIEFLTLYNLGAVWEIFYDFNTWLSVARSQSSEDWRQSEILRDMGTR